MSRAKLQVWPFIVLWAGLVVWTTLTMPVQGLGVNWGEQVSHPLPPDIVVKMLKANNIQKVKLFDSNSSVLNALAGSDIEVMVGIPNDLLFGLTDQSQATAWVQNNVVPYMSSSGTNIKYVAVGNEPFLKSYNGSYLNTTYPALSNVQIALNSANLGDKVKTTVPMNADVLNSSIVPSGTVFRDDIQSLMITIVQFLAQNNCPFTINIYPFISLYDNINFPIPYAFFNGYANPLIDGQYTYTNVFDASYDSLVVALTNANQPNMDILVGEIGWPTDGQVEATLANAKRFNQGFLDHVDSNAGTPRRPNSTINFYLFSLIDEDQKSIQPGNFERHWGIFRYDGKAKYELSVSSNGQFLVAATGVQYLTTQWCVLNANNVGNPTTLGESITYACANSDCTSLGYGCSCNPYLDSNGNASYAFNQYFQTKSQGLDTCDFNGLGKIVTQNPSVNICDFIVQIELSTTSATSTTRKGTIALVSVLVIRILFLL